MKKNGTMRVAGLLLALILISSCFVGSTFAKYVTSTTTTDSVRVAYWGFTAESNKNAIDLDLFDGQYTTTNTNAYKGANSVVAETVLDDEGDEVQDNVIAPGTKKSAEFSFVYTSNNKASAPEVAYRFTIDVQTTGSSCEELDANPNFVWTLCEKSNGTEVPHNTLAELVASIKSLAGDESGTKVYSPGELPAAFDQGTEVYVIGWEWKYETKYPANASASADAGTKTDLEGNTLGIANNGINDQDDYDTAMGNMSDLENLTITITITATQLD